MRAERAAEAARLRAQGLIYREIAERMGISRSYAAELCDDPEGRKVRGRKDSYRGTCEVCDGPTDGSNGTAAAPTVCQSCREQAAHERHDRVVAAWERGDTARAIAEREGSTAHSINTLIDHLRQRGRDVSLHRRINREAWPHIERRWNEGATPTTIAVELDTTIQNVSMMVRSMRAAGIDLPYHRVPRDPATDRRFKEAA